MKEIAEKIREPIDNVMDDCCVIAESMMEEIHQIIIPKSYAMRFSDSRHKDSLKKKLLRQIEQARKMTPFG